MNAKRIRKKRNCIHVRRPISSSFAFTVFTASTNIWSRIIHTSVVAPLASHSNLQVEPAMGGVSKATSICPTLFGTILNSCTSSFANDVDSNTAITRSKTDIVISWDGHFSSILLLFHRNPHAVPRDRYSPGRLYAKSHSSSTCWRQQYKSTLRLPKNK